MDGRLQKTIEFLEGFLEKESWTEEELRRVARIMGTTGKRLISWYEENKGDPEKIRKFREDVKERLNQLKERSEQISQEKREQEGKDVDEKEEKKIRREDDDDIYKKLGEQEEGEKIKRGKLMFNNLKEVAKSIGQRGEIEIEMGDVLRLWSLKETDDEQIKKLKELLKISELWDEEGRIIREAGIDFLKLENLRLKSRFNEEQLKAIEGLLRKKIKLPFYIAENFDSPVPYAIIDFKGRNFEKFIDEVIKDVEGLFKTLNIGVPKDLGIDLERIIKALYFKKGIEKTEALTKFIYNEDDMKILPKNIEHSLKGGYNILDLMKNRNFLLTKREDIPLVSVFKHFKLDEMFYKDVESLFEGLIEGAEYLDEKIGYEVKQGETGVKLWGEIKERYISDLDEVGKRIEEMLQKEFKGRKMSEEEIEKLINEETNKLMKEYEKEIKTGRGFFRKEYNYLQKEEAAFIRHLTDAIKQKEISDDELKNAILKLGREEGVDPVLSLIKRVETTRGRLSDVIMEVNKGKIKGEKQEGGKGEGEKGRKTGTRVRELSPEEKELIERKIRAKEEANRLRQEELELKRQRHSQQIKKLKEEKDKLEAENKELNKRIKELEKEKKDLEKKGQESAEEKMKLEKEINQLKEEKAQLEARKNQLIKQIEELTKSPPGGAVGGGGEPPPMGEAVGGGGGKPPSRFEKIKRLGKWGAGGGIALGLLALFHYLSKRKKLPESADYPFSSEEGKEEGGGAGFPEPPLPMLYPDLSGLYNLARLEYKKAVEDYARGLMTFSIMATLFADDLPPQVDKGEIIRLKVLAELEGRDFSKLARGYLVAKKRGVIVRDLEDLELYSSIEEPETLKLSKVADLIEKSYSAYVKEKEKQLQHTYDLYKLFTRANMNALLSWWKERAIRERQAYLLELKKKKQQMSSDGFAFLQAIYQSGTSTTKQEEGGE